MIFEYKGTDYEFPDDMDDEQALRLIKQDLGEYQSEPEPQPSVQEKKPSLGETLMNIGKKGLGTVGAVLSAPSRALGTFRTDPETGEKYKFSNQQSNLLRPEIEKTKKAVEQSTPMSEEDYLDNAMITGTIPTFTPSMQKETAKGLTEFVGSSLADPISYIGAPIKGAGSAMKGLGTKIESTVLGKGNKAILKKEGKTASEMAETALKENVGGSLGKTVEKVQDKLDVVEDNIQSILNTSVKNNPDLKINPDNVIENLKLRINNGEYPNLYGMEDQVISQLDNLKASNAKYKLSGEITVDKANQLKRIVGKKAFKKGPPSADTAPKEYAHDLLNLELKGEIEKIVPEIAAQNAIYKKLIPIQQMAKNRIPVSEANEAISLKDAMGVVTGNLPIIAADRATKSGTVAQALYNAGKPLAKVNPAAGVSTSALQQALSNMTEEQRRKIGR